MSSTIGDVVKLSVFGESHGAAIGVVLDGLPAGEPVDLEEIAAQMARRAPGRDKTATKRREADIPEILSGVVDGHTTGTPLCAVIRNSDAHSGDYDSLARFPRPGHADFTAHAHYHGFSDFRGGGHFSGRLTAPLVFAGALCRVILERRGVLIGAHLFDVGGACDTPFDPVSPGRELLKRLSASPFAVIDSAAEEKIRAVIENARMEGDSVGGIIECTADGLPAGLGDPMFDGVENRLAAALFGIPAVKGLEFGAGFSAAHLRGSENDDPFVMEGDAVRTVTNNHGGILGGITSGMPLLFRLAFKPTPSIYQTQQTVDLAENKNAELLIKGRHDPCVCVRAVPVVESVTAVCLLDLLLGGNLK